VQQDAPQTGSALPDTPPEMEEPEDEELPLKGRPRFGGSRFDEPKRPWWRPVSRVGRVFLTLTALVLLGGLAVSASLLKDFLSSDARFRIARAGNIEATGLTEVSRAELLPVFGEDMGHNIFFVPLGERRRQLEEIPWIEKATVMRLLPDQIRVSVVERQPVAFVRQGSQIGLVDASGVLLTMPAALMAQRHYSFPVVTGIDAHDSLAARKARMAVYQRLLSELDANGQQISAQISEIDLSDPADARVLMPEQESEILAHFGQDHFLERYQHYKENIAAWRQQYPKLAAVDLRYDQKVVLEMAPGADVAQAAAEAQNATGANDGEPAAGQIADKGQNAGDSAEELTPGAKARVNSAGSMRGLKPPAPSVSSLSTAYNAPAGSGSSDAKTKAAKAKATTAKNLSAKARTVNTQKKKRAEAQHAALNANRRKNAATNRPAASAGQGQ
jgi:cell division protein FtsQ